MMQGYEVADPRFLHLILPNAQLECLGEGFRWLEGPVWFADQELLLFSDIPNNRIMRWTEGSITIFRSPSHFTNGHARDRQGRLISCSHQQRCITRTEYDGRITVLADSFDGKPLNSPNDVVVKRDGSIWFTDPPYGINTDYEGGKQWQELPAHLYRLDPESGELTVAARDFTGPNGVCFSPDETLLYVTESGLQFSPDPVREIRVFKLGTDGKSLQNGRVFHHIIPGYADGVCCDEAGNLWSSAGDGVHCIAPDGTLLGKILTNMVVSNITFGGRQLSRLFICAGTILFAIYTNTRGVT